MLHTSESAAVKTDLKKIQPFKSYRAPQKRFTLRARAPFAPRTRGGHEGPHWTHRPSPPASTTARLGLASLSTHP